MLWLAFYEISHCHTTAVMVGSIVCDGASYDFNQTFHTDSATHIATPVVVDVGVRECRWRNKGTVPPASTSIVVSIAMVDFASFHVQCAKVVAHATEGTSTIT